MTCSGLRFYSNILAAVWETDGRWGQLQVQKVGGEKSDSREASWEARKRNHFQEENRKESRAASTNGRQECKLLKQRGQREVNADMLDAVQECRLKTSRPVCTLGRESWHTLHALHTFHRRAESHE